MKGLNVKKLAAIATGAALLGTAIAPIVTATNVTKNDIFDSTGSPNVNIVIGSQAQLSDAVWAGNLAAKIAEKAATTKQVSVSATGEGGAGADVDLSDLTVDITVGGTISFGAGSKNYNVLLSSGSTQAEYEVLTGQVQGDNNALTDAQLPHLYNATINQKVNNGDQSNQTTSLTVKELIQIDADAKFDTTTDVKDLVTTIDSEAFSYKVTIGSATSGVDLGSTSFTDGSDDNVKIIFFGEEYELNTASLSTTGTKNIKLVKSSARESYNEGEAIEGLLGDNEYADEEVSIKVVQIIQTGAAVAAYQATFELYDSTGNLIDTRTVSTAENLRDSFKDSGQDAALASNLFVDTIAVGATTGVGYVEVTKGTDTVELFNNGRYPYDSTNTSGTKPYKAILTVGTSDANSLYSIEVRNSAEKWTDPSGDDYDFGPLYPIKSGQSLTGKTGAQAVFLQGLPDGTQGKGYAKVEFLGFRGGEEKTVIEIGKDVTGLASGTKGGLSFRADNDDLRQVPFYLKRSDTNSGSTFEFEGKDVWYSMRFATGTGGKTTANDYNVTVNTGDYINGRIWTISGGGDQNASLSVQGVGLIDKDSNADNLAGGRAVWDNNSFIIDGVNYKVTDANMGAGLNRMGVVVDLAVELRLSTESGTKIYNSNDETTGIAVADASEGLLFLSNDSPFDGNAITAGSGGKPVTVGLYTTSKDRRVYYAAKYNTISGKLFLMLDADKMGSGQSDNIQNNHKISFLGTNVPSDNGTYTEASDLNTLYADGTSSPGSSPGKEIAILNDGTTTTWQYAHYVPKDSDFNTSGQNSGLYTAASAYFVAEFLVNDAVSNGDFNVYVDTETGGNIGPFDSTTNLTQYTNGDLRYRGTPAWNLKSGTTSTFLHSGYTDASTKAWLLDNDAGVKISAPQTAEKIDITVYGTEVTREVSGGETISLGIGDEGTTDSGTKVTVTAVNGGSCTIGDGSGSIVCTANPTSYTSPAAVKNPIVYMDTDAPAGTNIIVGGHIVNRLASSLADRLTAPGQKVAEVDAASGDIFVAGYTAQDTGSAVQELINDIDRMQLA
ncbi:MAG: S-layer protein [archaeon]